MITQHLSNHVISIRLLRLCWQGAENMKSPIVATVFWRFHILSLKCQEMGQREGRSKKFKEWMVKGEEQMLRWSEYPFLSWVSCGRRSSSEESDSLALYFGIGDSHTSVWGYLLYLYYYNLIKLWLQELTMETFTKQSTWVPIIYLSLCPIFPHFLNTFFLLSLL